MSVFPESTDPESICDNLLLGGRTLEPGEVFGSTFLHYRMVAPDHFDLELFQSVTPSNVIEVLGAHFAEFDLPAPPVNFVQVVGDPAGMVMPANPLVQVFQAAPIVFLSLFDDNHPYNPATLGHAPPIDIANVGALNAMLAAYEATILANPHLLDPGFVGVAAPPRIRWQYEWTLRVFAAGGPANAPNMTSWRSRITTPAGGGVFYNRANPLTGARNEFIHQLVEQLTRYQAAGSRGVELVDCRLRQLIKPANVAGANGISLQSRVPIGEDEHKHENKRDDESDVESPDESSTFLAVDINTENHCVFIALGLSLEGHKQRKRPRGKRKAGSSNAQPAAPLLCGPRDQWSKYRQRFVKQYVKIAKEMKLDVDFKEFKEKFNHTMYPLLAEVGQCELRVYGENGHLKKFYDFNDNVFHDAIYRPSGLYPSRRIVSVVSGASRGDVSSAPCDSFDFMDVEADPMDDIPVVRFRHHCGHVDPVFSREHLLSLMPEEDLMELTRIHPDLCRPQHITGKTHFREWEDYAVVVFDIEAAPDLDSTYVPWAIGFYGGLGHPKGHFDGFFEARNKALKTLKQYKSLPNDGSLSTRTQAQLLQMQFEVSREAIERALQYRHEIDIKFHKEWYGADCMYDFFKFLSEYGQTKTLHVVGHNAANFDTHLILEWIVRGLTNGFGFKLPVDGSAQIQSEDSIISLKIINRLGVSIKFTDLCKRCPGKLKDLCAEYGIDTSAKDIGTHEKFEQIAAWFQSQLRLSPFNQLSEYSITIPQLRKNSRDYDQKQIGPLQNPNEIVSFTNHTPTEVAKLVLSFIEPAILKQQAFPQVHLQFPEMKRYFAGDLKAPFQLLQKFRGIIEPRDEISVLNCYTVAGIARRLQNLSIPKFRLGSKSLVNPQFVPDKLSAEVDDFIRQTYLGGRNECWHLGKIPFPCYFVDAKSQYPSQGFALNFPTQFRGDLTFTDPQSMTFRAADRTSTYDFTLANLTNHFKTLDDFNQFVAQIIPQINPTIPQSKKVKVKGQRGLQTQSTCIAPLTPETTALFFELEAKATYPDDFPPDKWIPVFGLRCVPPNCLVPRTMFIEPDVWHPFFPTGLEVALALEYGLYELRIKRVFVLESRGTYKPFFEKYYNDKLNAERDGQPARKQVAKVIINSASGSPGIRPHDRESLIVMPRSSTDYLISCIEDGSYVTHHEMEHFYIIHRRCEYRPEYSNVAISSWFTASGRVETTLKMLDIVKAGGKLVYCETDSVCSSLNVEAHPNFRASFDPAKKGQMGQWCNETGVVGASYLIVIVIGAKMYYCFTDDPRVKPKKRVKMAMKGYPRIDECSPVYDPPDSKRKEDIVSYTYPVSEADFLSMLEMADDGEEKDEESGRKVVVLTDPSRLFSIGGGLRHARDTGFKLKFSRWEKKRFRALYVKGQPNVGFAGPVRPWFASQLPKPKEKRDVTQPMDIQMD